MEIKHIGTAGTMGSSDILVTIEKISNGIDISLNSSVEKQFGNQIRSVIAECIKNSGIENAKVTAVDKGALDCVIRARVETAVYRACDSQDYVWRGIK